MTKPPPQKLSASKAARASAKRATPQKAPKLRGSLVLGRALEGSRAEFLKWLGL